MRPLRGTRARTTRVRRSSNETIPNTDWYWDSGGGVARRVRPNIFERIEDRREHVDLEHQTVEVDTHAQIARTSTTRRSREKQTDHIPMTYSSRDRRPERDRERDRAPESSPGLEGLECHVESSEVEQIVATGGAGTGESLPPFPNASLRSIRRPTPSANRP